MTFQIRVAPGLRIAASQRGLRTGFGPRPTTVHLGSGRSGSGMFSYWASVTAREHHRCPAEPGRPPDLAALGSQIREARQPAQIAEAGRIEEAVTSTHLEEFPVIEAPEVAPPEDVEAKAVANELRSQALLGVGRWKVGARRQADRLATAATPDVVAERRRRADQEYQATRKEAESRFEALVANEPEAVLGALEAAFERRESPAAAIDCDGGTAAVVIRLAPFSAVPPTRSTTRRGSKPILEVRSEAERHALYLKVAASLVLAIVRQTLATAPGLVEVRILVVRPTTARQGRGPVEAVYAGCFRAATMAAMAWSEIDPVHELRRVPGHLLNLGDEAQVRGLDLDEEPDLNAVIKTLQAALHPGPGD